MLLFLFSKQPTKSIFLRLTSISIQFEEKQTSMLTANHYTKLLWKQNKQKIVYIYIHFIYKTKTNSEKQMKTHTHLYIVMWKPTIAVNILYKHQIPQTQWWKQQQQIRHFPHQHKHTLSSKRQNRVELTLSDPRNKRKPENTQTNRNPFCDSEFASDEFIFTK